MKRLLSLIAVGVMMVSVKAPARSESAVPMTVGMGLITLLSGSASAVANSEMYELLRGVDIEQLKEYRHGVYRSEDLAAFNSQYMDLVEELEEARDLLLESKGEETFVNDKSVTPIRRLLVMRAHDLHDTDLIEEYYEIRSDIAQLTFGEFFGTPEYMTAQNYYYLSHLLYRAFRACQFNKKECY